MEQKLSYEEFLNSKRIEISDSGFDCDNLPDLLFPFQKFIVKKALKKGRFAIFADCGLGKTFMQLAWADAIVKHEKSSVIIIAPLAVVKQTIQEGKKIGITVLDYTGFMHCEGIYITNYEQLEHLNVNDFIGIVLDESSIIKNEEGAYRNLLIDSFITTKYKLCCTATPSPNDPMELGNHSEFLNSMSYKEMLAMFFIHDGGETSKWRLKGHAVKDFYKFVSQWAIMLSKPSDIGFSDEGYILPGHNLIEHQIKTEKRDNGRLFNDAAVSATDFNKELRITLLPRIEFAADLVNKSPESFIVWVKQNEEGDLITKMINGAKQVKGADSPQYKANTLLDFANDKFRVLVSKVKVAGFGMNYQNCHNMIFCSADFSFEGIYQAIRRELRFGQTKEVNIWIVTTDTMENVIEAFKRKKKQFEDMQKGMQQHMNEAFNEGKNIVISTKSYESDFCSIKQGDSVKLIKELPDKSIDFSVFSPPFASLYTYSDNIADMGNCSDYSQFETAFTFLIQDLYRVMKEGRNIAIHCMDLPIQKGKEGYIGLRDFSGLILKVCEDAGFIYHSRVTIWKNPVTEMQRTKALGLLHKQVKKDSTMSRVGIPDYVLVFRKDGVRDNPVQCDISVDTWQQYASPVWMDIDYGDTLNAKEGRSNEDEKHICPLQLPTIKRLLTLYSNKGDKIFTPFLGIGSEICESIENGRYGIGFELKESYFDAAVKNVKASESKLTQQTLF